MKPRFFELVIILVVFGLHGALSATIEKKPPLFWPDARLIPIQVSYNTVISDGLEFRITKYNNTIIPFYSPSLSEWKSGGKLTFRNASIALVNQRNPKIKAGVSIVRTQDWLKEINQETLTRYVAAIRNQYPERLVWLNQDTGFAPIPRTGFLLGKPYKLVHYRINPEQKEQAAIEIWDFISAHKDSTIIFSFECPEPLAARNLDTAIMLISSLARMDELE